MLFENHPQPSSHSYPKLIRYILQKVRKNKCVCFHEIIKLITIKMKMALKKRSIDTT